MVDIIMVCQRCPHPNPHNCEYTTLPGNWDSADMITFKDPELGTLSWIVWMGPVLSQGSLKVEKGDRWGEGGRVMWFELTCWLWRWKKGTMSLEMQLKRPGNRFSLSLQKETVWYSLWWLVVAVVNQYIRTELLQKSRGQPAAQRRP